MSGPRDPSPAEVVAELRGAAIAIRLFGLDALPHVLNRDEQTPRQPNTMEGERRG